MCFSSRTLGIHICLKRHVPSALLPPLSHIPTYPSSRKKNEQDTMTLASDLAKLTSVFQPHHQIEVVYPCLELLNLMTLDETFKLPSIAGAATRHDPRALIEDGAVTAHSSRDNDAELSIFSLSEAIYTGPAEDIINSVSHDYSAAPGRVRIVKDMELIASCPGSTVLKAITFEAPEYVDDERMRHEMVLVSRETQLKSMGGKVDVHYFGYHMKLEELDAIPSNDLWIVNLKDALYRTSDHAVRHVRHQLGLPAPNGHIVQDVQTTWLPKRMATYERFEVNVAEVANAVPAIDPAEIDCEELWLLDGRFLDPRDREEILALPARERDCVIGYREQQTMRHHERLQALALSFAEIAAVTTCDNCGNDFDGSEHEKLQLICCEKIICRYCYIRSCGAKGPAHANCLYWQKSFLRSECSRGSQVRHD